ncbi:MAG: signal recognition particle-docking protein FtsY [Deltaproteobacteria bacterium]|nr:signal recognition particle-docking protein FtsY [Deltaproteobacteria bacterium]
MSIIEFRKAGLALAHEFAKQLGAMWQRLKRIFTRRITDAAFFAELEDTLLAGDVGPTLTAEWLAQVRKEKTPETVDQTLRGLMHAALAPLTPSPPAADAAPTPAPYVILILGVNGAGKTTTIAKLAHHFQQHGRRPLLVAGDTFRAAAIEQLQVWGGRLQLPVIASTPGADAGAVAFDGVRAAVARGHDVVLIDTAGRLHTRVPLMDELAKVQRVIGKALPGAPHERWCILDATIGQNALAQVQQFHERMGLTGLILTKCDGTAKAGAVFTLARTIPLPIHFIGSGEQIESLAPFTPAAFIERLLGNTAVTT